MGCAQQKLHMQGETSFYVEYNSYLGYIAKISGGLKNISGEDLSYAAVEFIIYDGRGNALGIAKDSRKIILDKGTWAFSATAVCGKEKPEKYTFYKITAKENK